MRQKSIHSGIHMTHFLAVSLFPLLIVIAGVGDVLTLRIPNWLNLIIALLFLPAALAAGMAWDQMGLHAAAGLSLLVIGFALFAAGLFGGGDAKLLAAAGLWMGPGELLPFLMATALAGGILALCVAGWSMIGMNAEIQDTPVLRRASIIKPNVPYGFAFAVGAIMTYPQTWWFTAAGG